MSIPNWARNIAFMLLVGALATWVFAPLLDVVPAFILFGTIFVLGFVVLMSLLRWNPPPDGRTRTRMLLASLVVAGLWGSFVLALYGITLEIRHDSTWGWWMAAGGICFGALLLVAWLVTRKDKTTA